MNQANRSAPVLQARDINPGDFFHLSSNRERMIFLLQYGVLAPSTHNSQPWQFRLGDDFCEVLAHDEYPIVYADPKGRDFYVSFGCLIENVVTAAKYFDVFKSVEYLAQKPGIANIHFDFSHPCVNESLEPLLRAITTRVTARGLFEADSVDAASGAAFEALPVPPGLARYFLNRGDAITEIAELTRQGLVMAYRDPRFRNEMAHWFNNSVSHKPSGIPGYSVRMPFLLSFVFPWLVRHFDLGKRLGFLNYASIASAPAAMIITAKKDAPSSWIETGRFAERFVLEANVHGYKTSFFTAAIEMGELYHDVQKLLGTDDVPQFIIIFGKMKHRQKPNLRYSAESKVLS